MQCSAMKFSIIGLYLELFELDSNSDTFTISTREEAVTSEKVNSINASSHTQCFCIKTNSGYPSIA